MKSTILLVIGLLSIGCQVDSTPKRSTEVDTDFIFNRAPLAPNAYTPLPLGAVTPEGWLREQLQRMANGMTGHLDEWYPTVGASNGWLGGDGDVWERGPYWLDGLLPLGYLLGDQNLIDKAKPYIEWTLASQDSTGYFGPAPEPEGTQNRPQQQRTNAADWWPRMVMLKVLQQHYEATGDERVLDLMSRYFRYQLARLDSTPLNQWTGWGRARGGENQASALWLYNLTGDSFLLELAQKLFEQTDDWTGDFEAGKVSEDYWMTHVVNVAMAIKQPAQQYILTRDRRYLEAIRHGLKALMQKHGQAVGMFSGDELLHSTDPVHGIELCAVVEFMFSLESLMVLDGEVAFIDRLERVAYNALPTQVTDDQMARQYFQQVNQVNLTRGDHGLFFDAYEDAICYGLLTGYPCCTTNLHQGWPKLTRNTWLATADGGLAMLIYAPTSVRARVRGGHEVVLRASTSYPMEDAVRIEVSEANGVSFPLHLRIPAWSDHASVAVNGAPQPAPEAGSILVIDRNWSSGDVIEIQLPAAIEISRWHENAVAVHRGPLLFALPIDGDERRVPAIHAGTNTDLMREVRSDAAWNYGLIFNAEHPEESFELVSRATGTEYPWTDQAAPVRLVARGVRLPNWTEYNTTAGPMPPSPVYVSEARMKEPDGTEKLELIPYGATTLRVAVFPEVRVR